MVLLMQLQGKERLEKNGATAAELRAVKRDAPPDCNRVHDVACRQASHKDGDVGATVTQNGLICYICVQQVHQGLGFFTC